MQIHPPRPTPDTDTVIAYCLGLLPNEMAAAVSHLARSYPGLHQAIDETAEALRCYGAGNHLMPDSAARVRLFGTLHRLAHQPPIDLACPPLIDRYADLARWQQAVATISRPPSVSDLYIHPLRNDGLVTQLLVWVADQIQVEEHQHERESLLLLGGNCTGYVGVDTVRLCPGDYLDIPLHTPHRLAVSSAEPALLIVQRVKLMAT